MFLNKLRTAFLAIAVVAAVGTAVFAQPSTATSEAGRRFAGEKLSYEGKLNWMALSFAVADLTFTGIESPDNSGLLIKAEATSKGTLASMFHYSFLQQINTNVDLAGFRAAKTEKHDVHWMPPRLSARSEGRSLQASTEEHGLHAPPRRLRRSL